MRRPPPMPCRVGGYSDDASGTTCVPVLFGARWYAPSLGRWLTQDPIGYEGGANLYEYCGGDPVNSVDPFGLDAVIIWGNNEHTRPYNPYYFKRLAEDRAREYEAEYTVPSDFGDYVTQHAHVFRASTVADFEKALNTPNIDTLIYYGHAGWPALYLSGKELKKDDVGGLPTANITKDCHIELLGCDTADQDTRYNIAQLFADHFHTPVLGSPGPLSFGYTEWKITVMPTYPHVQGQIGGLITVQPRRK